MPDTLVCPQCRNELPTHAPAGLCPRCLVEVAAGSQPPLSAPADPRFSPTATSPRSAVFQPPAIADLAACFPQWEITELLGVGGMGAVYRARQPDLDRSIAVKILPPEVARDPLFAERFMREARALAKLSHPNIVAVYDFGRSAEYFYFAMEFVDGANLRQMLRTGKLRASEALAIVPQICEALQYAHDEGVVHRDIKPENILLDKKGRVKIADFGLSKLLDCPEGPLPSLTGTHQVMGTLRYMAPEQIEATKTVDHRADIYSLGVVFYELLTGEIPMGRFAPPSKKAEVDVRLDEVVLRSLEREPADRYQQAAHVRDDLSKVTSSNALSPPQSQPASAGRSLDAAAAALFCSGLALTTVGLLVVLWVASMLGAYAMAPASSSQNGVTVTVTNKITLWYWVALVTQFLAAGAGTAVMVASSALRRRESLPFAKAGCWISLLPLSPAWIVTFPAGLWALLTLQRPPIARLFESDHPSGHERSEIQDAVLHLGLWRIIAAVIAAMGVIATFLPWQLVSFFGVRIVIFGPNSWYALGAGTGFVIVVLATILVAYFRWPLRGLRILSAVAGLGGLLGNSHLLIVSAGPAVTKSSFTSSGMSPEGAEAMAKPMLDLFTSGLSGGLTFGFWISFVASVGLLILACIPLGSPRLDNSRL